MRNEFRTLIWLVAGLAGIYYAFVWPYTENFEISAHRCAELNNLWSKKYSQDFQYSGDWEAGSFECPSAQSGFVQGLDLLAQTTFEQPDHQKVVYYEWAKGLQPTFANRPMFGSVGISHFADSLLELNAQVLERNNPVEIANIIVHELRHLDQGFNTHVPCRRFTDRICDNRLEENPINGGAYNYNILFLHHLRNHSDASTRNKRRAKKLMQEIFDGRFNVVSADDRNKYKLD